VRSTRISVFRRFVCPAVIRDLSFLVAPEGVARNVPGIVDTD
jgi:hypothetical protein